MDTNANSGASGATDTSSVTAIKVQVVLDTTTEQLKKQFSGIQTDIEKDPIGLTFGVDKKTSKDAIIKGLQEILGKGTNITIGAGVDPNAGNKVKNQVKDAANAGQQTADKNKVKIKVQTDVDDRTKNKLDAYYKRLKERYDLEAKIASSTVNGVINPELDGAGKRLKAVRAELKQLKSELQGKIPTDKYSKAYEIWHSGQARIAAAGQSASGTLNRREGTKNATLTKREVQEKLNEFYTQQKKAGALEQASLTLGNKTANSKELEAVKTQLEKAQESAKNFRTELSNLLPDEEIDKLTKFDNELDDNLIRIKGRIADQNAAKTKSESDAQLKAAKKAKISEYNSELSNFKKLTLDSARLEGKSNSENELSFVNQQMEDSLNNLNKLQTDLGDVLSKNELDEIIRQYEKFESDLADEVTRIEAHYEDLKNARESTKATAEEKRQAKQTDDYTNDLATARNKYKNMSGVPADVSSALDNVDAQIKKLDTLKVGTEDYANQLKAIGTAWIDATRQMDSFDKVQKDTENHVKSMTEQALKWQKSINGNTEEADNLRKSIQRILSIEKSLNPDHSSDKYAKGVAAMDDAFIDAKASMSAYKSEYKNLESQATSTLTKIRKAEMQLAEANNTAFDNLLKGQPGYIGDQDGSFEGRIRKLNEMNSQSEEYRTTLKGIQDDWQKISLRIQQALKSEEDLQKEAEQKHGQVRSKQAAYNTIQNRLSSTEFTRKNSVALGRFNTGVLDDGKTGQQVLAELDAAMKQLDENKGPTEFKATLSQVDDLLVQVRKHIDDALGQSRQTKTSNTDTDKMENLMRTLYQYKETLHGFEGSKLEAEYNELFDAIKNSSYSFEEAQMRVSKFQNACHQAGLETETLGQKLSRLFKEHFQTAIAMAGVAMIKQGLREVYNNVVDIDTSMTNLKKVTNETESAYSSFLSSASSQARELGASISDVIDSTAEWSRLGYTLDESQELAKWSTVLSNIGDGIDSASDAASYLVSILKGFRMEADEVEHVVNVLNSVGNNEPISESGIAEALVRSASALSAAGNSFEESVSLISAANSVLQDPDTVGTTLKTISMYLRASKTDAEAFGVSVDDMASSVSELRSELKSLTGVDIMKDAAGTEFKSTYQILKEISAVWDKLTDVSKANVTEMLGGKRNSNAVLSVIEQFSIAEKSMEDAANSSNSAMTEQERMMDSIEGRLKRLNASFEKFSNDVMSSDLIKFFVTLATKIVDAADGMVNLAGSIPAITAAISGVLSVMQMSGKLKNGAGKVNMPSYICCV